MAGRYEIAILLIVIAVVFQHSKKQANVSPEEAIAEYWRKLDVEMMTHKKIMVGLVKHISNGRDCFASGSRGLFTKHFTALLVYKRLNHKFYGGEYVTIYKIYDYTLNRL